MAGTAIGIEGMEGTSIPKAWDGVNYEIFFGSVLSLADR